MKELSTFILIITFILALVNILYSQIPDCINYQGKLTDADGVALEGVMGVKFTIYAVSIGGNPLWSDSMIVDISKGLFDVLLGSITPFPDTLDFSKPYWIELKVESETLLPRQPLTSMPYSFHSNAALSSDTANFAHRSSTSDTAWALFWSDIINIPPGFADGDDDTGHFVTNTIDTFIAYWDSLRYMPVDFADGTDDTGHFEANTVDTFIAYWSSLRNIPLGFRDGIDDVGLTSVNTDATISGNGTGGLPLSVVYGSSANSACMGNDPRLSNSRPPSGPAGGDLFGTYPDPSVADNSHYHDYTTITTNIVSSVEDVTNDGGNIDLVEGSNVAISHDDGANTITIGVTGLDNYGFWTARDDDGDSYTITSGDVLTFDEGTGIDIDFTGDDNLTITHKDQSDQGSIDNAGGTVIQDVSLDWSGHVTSLESYNLDNRYYTESESDSRYIRNQSSANQSASFRIDGSGYWHGTGSYSDRNVGIWHSSYGRMISTNDFGIIPGGGLVLAPATNVTMNSGGYFGPTVFIMDGTNQRIGIGVLNPQNKLDVEGAAVIGASYSGTNDAPSNGLLVEGNVGIGETSPGVKLHVNGNGSDAIYGRYDDNHYGYVGTRVESPSYYGVYGRAHGTHDDNPDVGVFGRCQNAYLNSSDIIGADKAVSGYIYSGEAGLDYWSREGYSGVMGRGDGANSYTFGVIGERGNYSTYRCGGVLGVEEDFGGPGDWGALGYTNSGGTDYGGYFSNDHTDGVGRMRSLPDSEVHSSVGLGSYGDLMGGWIRGNIYGLNVKGERYGLYVDGNSYMDGTLGFLQNNAGEDRVVGYANVSTDVTVTASGIGELSDGSSHIGFDENFKALVSHEIPVVVTVSPLGSCEGIYISGIDARGFTVIEDHGGKSNIGFTWIAIGRRAGYENPEVPYEVAASNFDGIMDRFMFNDSDKRNAAIPVWWDGNRKFQAGIPIPVTESERRMEEAARKYELAPASLTEEEYRLLSLEPVMEEGNEKK
ncbi:hypothetical protein JXI42_01550 [bacterium]|nr:hypothetical protein [bacterium]